MNPHIRLPCLLSRSAAAEAGCRYYCIDAGWYDDGPWWDGVGEWLPAKGRFPGGIGTVLDYIRWALRYFISTQQTYFWR